MKISLIKASEQSDFKEYKKFMGAPPQNIFSAAAATPTGIEIEMVDETADMRPNFGTDADIIFIFMSTPDALRAYHLANQYKLRGKTVVLGGLHTTFLPEEALKFADAVIIGEVENVWHTILADFQQGNLKRWYKSETPVDVTQLKPYPRNLIRPKQYKDVLSVLVSRGCRYHCSFCLVTPFFAKKAMRYRPIGDVVDEIKQSGAKYVELHSDNLTADPNYAKELFTALKPLNIQWVGETTIDMAADEEMLRLAAESGLTYLLVGLETPSPAALKKAGKGFIRVEEVKKYIENLHHYNIAVDSAFVFGFDEHDDQIFQQSLDFAREIKLDVAHGVTLIPFPGSRTFQQLEEEDRILTRNWAEYDGAHAIFQPKHISPKTLEEGAKWFNNQFYSLGKMLNPASWWLWAW